MVIRNKPWGKEFFLLDNGKFTMKILQINKNSRLSLQFHEKKHEAFYVLSGHLFVQWDKWGKWYYPGQHEDIPPKTIHRFHAFHTEVQLLECYTGPKDDITRLADDYGRLKQ